MSECCGARRPCQGWDWRHDQDNGWQEISGRTLELCFLDHYKRHLWRKWEKNICCLFHYESSHSFYLSIKFILLANIKSFMLCHYSQAMVCPPPMTMFGPAPAPAILSSHNSPPVSWKTLRGALTVEKCSLEQLNWIYYSRAWVYYFQMEFYYFFVWRFVKSKYWFKILKILKGLSVSEWCQVRI